MATTGIRLTCPAGDGVLERSAAGAACPACGRTVPVDARGTLLFGAADGGWPGVPRDRADALARAGSAAEAVAALTDGEGAVPSPVLQRLMRPAGGAPAALLPPGPGRRVLDVASGRLRLAEAVQSLGDAVVRADWVHPRLALAALLGGAVDADVLLERTGTLPFADATFDAVVLDLVEVGAALGPDRLPAVLREVRRVLIPQGRLVVRTGNPLRRGSGPSRVLAAARSARRPWGEAALRRAGFSDVQVWAAHPHVGARHALVPLAALPAHLASTGGPRRRAARQALRRAGARAGAARWLVADYFVVAGGPRDAGVPRTVVEALPPFQAGEPPLVQQLSDARVAVVAGRHFVKLPLSRFQQEAVVAEVERTEQARTTAFGPHVLAGVRVERAGGVPFAVYPRLSLPSRPTAAELEAALLLVLRGRDHPVPGPLGRTAVWRRSGTPRGRDDVADLGAGPLLGALEAHREAVVPVGPTHGDLHADNLVLVPGGEPVLVDWNRFEPDNPLLLDPAYAAVRAHEQGTGCTLAEALVDYATGRLGGPLAEDADALLGELGRPAAAGLVLLDRIVSYGEPRRLNKPWTLAPLRQATDAVTAVLT